MNGYVYSKIFHLYKNCSIIADLDIPKTEHIAEQLCVRCNTRKTKEDAKLATRPGMSWIFPELN
jgi:hypothetical protein